MNIAEINKIVINLYERKDRLDHAHSEFRYIKSNNLDGFWRMPGIIHKDPKKGIGQAHVNSIKFAKENKWDNVMILEDDFVFQAKENTLHYVNEGLNNIPDKWDILLGGVYEAKHKAKQNAYWDRIGQFCGLHCYIVNSAFYDHILTYDGEHHIDRWMNLNADKNVFVSNQFFCTQLAGYSDNVKSVQDYSARLHKFKILY